MNRTLFVNGKFAAQHTTGVQRVATELVRAIDRRLSSRRTHTPCTLLVPRGAKPLALQRLPVSAVGPARSLPAWEQLHLPRAARSGLLLNLAGSAPAWGAAQACYLHDAAVFDHPHAYTAAFRSWYRFLFGRVARSARSVFTVSAFSRHRLSCTLGLPASRIRVIPNGADHLSATVADDAALVAHGLAERPFLLAVGSANPTKNFERLVQAWRELNRADARLVIVGGINRAVFAPRGNVDAAGVLHLGQVSDGELKALYRRAHGLVFPSLYEGFGLPALEAMACGCPVASSHAASLPEVCGDAALYFDPHSVTQIAGAMRALLDDGALRDALRDKGQLRARLYRWDDSAAALLQALEALT